MGFSWKPARLTHCWGGGRRCGRWLFAGCGVALEGQGVSSWRRNRKQQLARRTGAWAAGRRLPLTADLPVDPLWPCKPRPPGTTDASPRPSAGPDARQTPVQVTPSRLAPRLTRGDASPRTSPRASGRPATAPGLSPTRAGCGAHGGERDRNAWPGRREGPRLLTVHAVRQVPPLERRQSRLRHHHCRTRREERGGGWRR